MPVINILAPHVADMIAAGEVVERPASVIKELMENSFDAGARNVCVEIKNGGATLIRVSDDGCGMSPEDAGVAFLRHATSKLKDEKGLEAIGTMGFRGEALAAIAAVSRIELSTRRKGSLEGTRVSLSAGDIQDMGPTGCPEGTLIEVRDLFYNTPARLKFLKSDRSEASACVQTALRCALGRPEISVRFIRDGKEEFFSPGDGRADSCLYSLLGRELSKNMLECVSEDEKMSLRGFVSIPSAGRGNRSAQYFYCNGRYIRSAMLQAAVEQAYKNSLLTGRYPACVMYLDISWAAVDVNVHPAKTEVKFAEEKKVFDLVYYSVRSALERDRGASEAELSRIKPAALAGPASTAVPAVKTAEKESRAEKAEKKADKAEEGFFRSMSAEDFRKNNYSLGEKGKKGSDEVQKADSAAYKAASPAPVYKAPAAPISPAPLKGGEKTAPAFKAPAGDKAPGAALFSPGEANGAKAGMELRSPTYHEQLSLELPQGRSHGAAASKNVETAIKESDFPHKNVDNSVQNVENSDTRNYKLIGEALKTYIICERDGEMILIDKHAAHERMVFDRLKARGGEIMSQTLLASVPLRLSAEDGELLEENGELLSELGFEIELLGESGYVIRAVPADMAGGDAAAAVEEICEKLRRGRRLSASEAWDEILHTVACKAAIKAGWDSHRQELELLVDEVMSGRVKYCPHGRPVAVSLSRRELDKLFKRIV